MRDNFCFDGATPIIYRMSPDAEIIIESIADAYKAHKDDTVYVCVHTLGENRSSTVSWKAAKFCHTQAIQMISVYVKPDIDECDLESENVIRVTPNHIFPVLTKQGIKDVEAYLLETGDNLIYEHSRKFNDGDNISEDVADILQDKSEHSLVYRRIVKVVKEDVSEDSEPFGIDFYGLSLIDAAESKYFMLCNSAIVHDSSVD